MNLRQFLYGFFVLTFFSSWARADLVERPPQFVNLAFDGSKSHRMWGETLNFAEENSIRFTYFISGVYFLSDKDKKAYKGPRHRLETAGLLL